MKGDEMLFKPKRKTRITGKAFIKYLEDCGVIDPDERIKYVMIEASDETAVTITVVKYGTLDLIQKEFSDVDGDPVTVNIVETK